MKNKELETAISDKYVEVYKKCLTDMTQDQWVDCCNLLGKVITTIFLFIEEDIDAHKDIYSTNETYKEFIIKFGKSYPKEFQDSIARAKSNKSMDIFRSVRSFGLSSLTKAIFKRGHKTIKQKFTEYVNAVEDVLWAFNADDKENGMYFPVLLMSVIATKNIVWEAYKETLSKLED